MKIKNWQGDSLKGEWVVSIKIDGVRMLRDAEGNPISKSGKPLYNLDHIPTSISDCEVFFNSWEETISLVRTKSKKKDIPLSAIYSLDNLDSRLYIDTVVNPTSEYISQTLEKFLGLGFEGLVLRSESKWIKVKPTYSEDVEVIGYVPGKLGKHYGRLGSLITPLGNVGTGLKDIERDEANFPLGTIIEVEFMEKTPAGKFRHPRFIRKRVDK